MMHHYYRAAAAASGGGGAANQVLWTPAEITTQLWLDAADAGTITIDTGVSQWNDKSGNGYNVVQATTSEQPALLTAELNGLDIVSFNGSSDYLWNHDTDLRNAWRNVGYGWSVVLYKKTIEDGSGVQRNAFVSTTGGGGGRLIQFISKTTANNTPVLQSERVDSSGNLVIEASSGGSTYDVYAVVVQDVKWADDECAMYIDGTQVASDSGVWGAGNTSDTISNGAFVVGGFPAATGANPPAANHADMDLAEAIFGNTELTTDIRQRMEGYILWRRGLEGNLPVGHPYEFDPPYV
jgi:hypothetical protein